MAQLHSLTVSAPGFYGLNRQSASGLLDANWATEVINCVFDDSGRIASRKGWVAVGGELDGPVTQIAEYIDDTGTSRIIFVSNNRLYVNPTSPTDITGTLTPTAGNWKFQNFNGKIVGFQKDHTPIIWDSSAEAFEEIVPTSGTIPKGNEVLSAYGRLWTFDETATVLHYSDLLIPDVWNDHAQPGSSGVIDLKSVWVYGRDTGVAIAAFNGFLVIFGKNSILIYANPDDPSNMQLVEVIHGIGCVARDSVATVGEDLLFLSNSGVRSLGRVIQEKSLPLGEETKNIRDYLMKLVRSEDPDKIRTVYSEYEGFYLISLPSSFRTICVDMKTRLEDGSRRITEWTDINPLALCVTQDQTLYIGKTNRVGIYNTYLDNGAKYRMTYLSGWVKVAQGDNLVIVKNLGETILAESNVDYVFRWAFDHQDRSYSYTKKFTTNAVSEYGEAEYEEAEYSGGSAVFFPIIPAHGQGRVIKFGGETEVNGSRVSIQQVTVQAKVGRI